MAGTGSGGTGSGGTGNGGGGGGGPVGSSSGPAQERITTAPNFACAIRSDGTIACWGQATKAPAGTFDAISSGGEGEVNACALSGTQVTCWGANSNGQSGERATAYKAVAAGGIFTCGIRSSDSKIECWGIGFATNFMFEGTATAVDAGVPVTCALYTNGQIDCRGGSGTNWTTPSGKFSALSTGEHHACAIRDDSSIVCWGGSNLSGEETAPSGSFIAVSAGYAHSCAIRTDNTVACWGGDTHGEASPPPGKFAAVAASMYGFYTCGIHTDGSIACWGYDDSGQTKPPGGSFLPP
jgi:alpha-tubulin suppressor-like RCC1 family protein